MSKKSLILVIIQFSCFVLLAFSGTLWAKGLVLIFQIFALLFTIWATLTLRIGNFNIQPEVLENAKFITTGPYKISRNPIYTGLLLFFGSGVFYHLNYYNAFVFLILSIVLILKIKMEEIFLKNHFGRPYKQYKEKTFRLIPYVY